MPAWGCNYSRRGLGLFLPDRFWHLDVSNPLQNLRKLRVSIEEDLMPISLVQFDAKTRICVGIKLSSVGLRSFVKYMKAHFLFAFFAGIFLVWAYDQCLA